VETLSVPRADVGERIAWTDLGAGIARLTLRFGYMEDPDVPRALLCCKANGLDINLYETSYFLSRETVVPSADGCMAPWRERLFAGLSRNAGSAADFLHIPHHSTIELGTRVQI